MTSFTVDPLADAVPLGGLECWLRDPEVTEVMVNGGTSVWVERHGEITHVGTTTLRHTMTTIEHILAPLGRRLDRAQPWVDARLADGSRVCAVIPPLAIDGPCLSIRRFSPQRFTLADFTDATTAAALAHAVTRRRNIVVSGAASTGKTSLVNVLAATIPHTERVVTLEDTAELLLHHPHVVRLECRDATPDGVGAIGLDQLLRVALRLRPDRLVVGEVRGAEALHLLHALNTGHHGSLATVHANSAHDALARLAALVTQAAPAWGVDAAEELVHRAIDVVVYLQRSVDGARHIHDIHEVVR
jgi:pilus assembly protein CpaF